MTPDLDVPLSISGSGFINLAIRWIELRFGDILEYIEQFGKIEPEHATSLKESFHSESIGNYSGKISVIPRFLLRLHLFKNQRYWNRQHAGLLMLLNMSVARFCY